MKLSLYPCTIQDLPELTKISRRTFRDAFETQNNPADFNHYLNTSLTTETLARELQDPDRSFYFALQNDEIVGYFKLNENQAQTDLRDSEGLEIERIYVLQEFQGKKIGEWMMGEIARIGHAKVKKYIWLGVWEQNLKAILFYERLGFIKFGKHPYYIGKDRQMDWLMKLNIPTLPS